jgi:hypothetical protein
MLNLKKNPGLVVRDFKWLKAINTKFTQMKKAHLIGKNVDHLRSIFVPKSDF